MLAFKDVERRHTVVSGQHLVRSRLLELPFQYIADNWALPVQDPENVGPWRQEGSQPPLYYALAAAATSWIDTSDLETARYLNPHVDNGVATPDGNINLIVHHPTREAFPWRGTVLAVHLIRLLSVGMGAATVYLTYLIVRELSPKRPGLAVGAAAVNAFTPMFIFISGAVNNDNLVVPLCSLALLLMIRIVLHGTSMPRRRFMGLELLLGIVVGLAALTKQSGLPLFPLAVLAVGFSAWETYSQEPLPRRLAWVVGHSSFVVLVALTICGWWYWRNWVLYGDPLGWNVFVEILGQRDVPADLAQLWRERFSFTAGYWGNFGGLNVPMPAWIYSVLNWITVVSAVGLVIGLVKRVLVDRVLQLRLDARNVALVICFLWPAGVLFGWIRWARITWSSQGRLLFSAISILSALLALGITWLVPRRYRPWSVLGIAVFLLGVSVLAPFVWIRPAYALPDRLDAEQVNEIPERVDVVFGETLRLLGYGLETQAVEPGGAVELTLYWEALSPADQDLTVFVHLLGEGDLLVAQRDTYPAMGRLSATWLEPGFSWADRIVLNVPGTAYTPDVALIEVGLYESATGHRLPVVDSTVETLGDNYRFGRVSILPLTGNVPNPIAVDFGGEMELVGYDLSERVVTPSETISLTLHWRGQREMEANYTISAQLVDSDQRKAAQHDGWPLDGDAPTLAWTPGELLTDVRTLTVYEDALPGVYNVRLVVYQVVEGEIVHLPVMPEGGEMPAEHIVLTVVRVEP